MRKSWPANKRCFPLCLWIASLARRTRIHHVAAVPASRQVLTEHQPDGTPISLLLRGDETNQWMTDVQGKENLLAKVDGTRSSFGTNSIRFVHLTISNSFLSNPDYIVTKTDDGSFVYVEESNEFDDRSTFLSQSNDIRLVGKFEPKQFRNDQGLARHGSRMSLGYGDSCFKRICGGIPEPTIINATENDQNIFARSEGGARHLRGNTKFRYAHHLLDNNPSQYIHRRQSELPTTGTIRNLVILVQFGDHERIRRDLPSIAHIEDHMASVKELFLENSYGKLTIDSTVVPTWYTTKSAEAWYADKRSG